MDPDLRTCPGCGASTPNHSPCLYCGWAPERIEPTHPAKTSQASPSETEPNEYVQANPHGDPPQVDDPAAKRLHDLMDPQGDPEHLLDQVPEEMRGVLAARLKAAEERADTGFSDQTASTLREQGYMVSEDARGARLAASPGQAADLSASDVVKMAAELDGGVQPKTNLPICDKCQAASPIGETQCQWCGEPFD